MSEAKSIFIYFYASSPDHGGCCSMDVKIRVCLPRKYGRFMLFIDNNLLLPGARLHILNNIYRINKIWKTIEKRRKKHARLTYQAKSLPLQREFGRVVLPWVRSNGPTEHLHISCICSIWKIFHFYSSFSLNPSKPAFFHALTLSLLPNNHMLFIVSKQCAYTRRIHIEGHMNRFEFLLSWIIIPITIVLGLFWQKIVSFAA
jgi:hypothetical protein